VPNGTTHRSGTSGTSNSSYDWIWGLIVLLVIAAVVIFIIVKIVGAIKKSAGAAVPAFDDSKPTVFEFDQGVLQRIKSSDPDFNPDGFMNKAKEIAERLQAAWSAGDMLPVRNYVSQGIFSRYRLQLELMMKDEKLRNVVGDYKIIKIRVGDMSASKSYDTLHVSIYAAARDVMVSADATDEQAAKVLKSATKAPFTEIYSFTRKVGVKTNTSRDWLKGECPNCGYVPDNFSQVNKCSSCGSIYNSGEYDWVLSEITQEEEWSPVSAQDVEGLAGLEGKNLSINREVIEDRASFLFWRWIFARVRGTSAPLSRDATQEFRQSMGAGPEPMSDISVGAVDLENVKQEGGDVRSEVKVLWSRATPGSVEPYHQEHRFMLSMPLTMKNPYGLADHSCPGCGGPLPETDATSCSYCGAELPAQNTDWILTGTQQIDWENNG
jgi:hypothetical protein